MLRIYGYSDLKNKSLCSLVTTDHERRGGILRTYFEKNLDQNIFTVSFRLIHIFTTSHDFDKDDIIWSH